ncbi:MAG: S9 family peptidase [Candidatus Dormibacteraeota bacterium]|nr:S9 family peptidase [Candidatus Dormibacteraeota bacterium]
MSADTVKPKSAPPPRRLVGNVSPHTVRRYSGPAPLAFSPDGLTLAFVSPRDDTGVVAEVAVAGGEPRDAFTVQGAAAYGLAWSPTGDLYCSADRGGTERWQVYVRRPNRRLEDFVVSEDERVQHHMSRWAVSPDGKSIAISTNGREAADVDVAIVDSRTKNQRLVISEPAWHTVGGWSPDGRWLCVMRVAQNTDQDLLALEADSGEVTEVTTHRGEMQNVPAGWLADGRMLAITDHDSDFLHLEAIDIHSGAREIYDQPAWDVEVASTSSDGRGVAWCVNEDGYSRLRWRFEDGAVGDRETGGAVDDLVVANDGARAAYTVWPASGPVEIRILELATGEDRLLLRGEALPQSSPGPDSIRIPGTEGDIPCYVYRPAPTSGRMPAVLVIHGGPEGQSRPILDFPLLTRLLNNGIALVVPNVHGSTGYGKAWQTRIHRDWGGIDLADFRSVADWMRTQSDFDPDRLGVFGGSYGGFASLTCVTRLPEYWCCGVDIMGPSNLVTMLENDPPNWRRWNKLWIGDLETDRDKLVQRSPMTYVDNVRCPLLVIQGDNDPRIPREESDQIVERLRALGRPVEYLTFKGEGHGFAQPENRALAFDRMAEFLERYLLRRIT